MMKTLKLIVPITASLIVSYCLFAQGPLTPPAAPAPTMRTLLQIEPRTPISSLPFTITQPGSYYVTSNLTGVVGENGITIAASGVTLDLMGFELAGAAGSFDGISVSGSRTNIAVRNGFVRGWNNIGVNAGSAISAQLERLVVSSSGFNGISTGTGSTIKDCTAQNNGAHGIALFAISSTINGCTAINNTDNGILAGTGSTIKDCTVSNNGGVGIDAGDGCIINGCTARANSGHGIRVSSRCRVADNNCVGNGTFGTGIGIWVMSGENRIDGNNVVNNFRGMVVDAGGNAVIRNTARGNVSLDYSGAGLPGSAVGEILNFSSGGTITNVSPWANFRN